MAPKGSKRIVSDPDIMMGKPVFEGTRITVESILERLGSGESIVQIQESHPGLEKDDIYNAISFASKAMKADTIYPAAS